MKRSWCVGVTGLVASVIVGVTSAGFGGGPPGQSPPPPPPPTRPGDPFPGLGISQKARFAVGLQQFTEAEDVPGGLGPVYNDVSCFACHSLGGTGGAGNRLVTRFGRWNDGVYDTMVDFGGPLIQGQGIGVFNGVDFVAEVVPPQATVVAQRRAVPVFGLGLVDAVPDGAFLSVALQEARDNPDTAGRISHVVEAGTGPHVVGRFGWKAQHANLFAFAGDAYFNELGVTTPLIPDENCPQGNCALLAANPAPTNPNDPDNGSIRALADFMTFLAPVPRGRVGPDEDAGQGIFGTIGCTDCHRPSLNTGPNAVAALNNVAFSPYSDYLLHDMGSLGDGIVQATAGPTEMRTPPLWGLRYQPAYLHDGRAATPRDAILRHQGQGRAAGRRFAGLNPRQQSQLLAFLNSL